jgi:hypothetical protein
MRRGTAGDQRSADSHEHGEIKELDWICVPAPPSLSKGSSTLCDVQVSQVCGAQLEDHHTFKPLNQDGCLMRWHKNISFFCQDTLVEFPKQSPRALERDMTTHRSSLMTKRNVFRPIIRKHHAVSLSLIHISSTCQKMQP